ncbi:MAG: tRNA preQ1(34) S-adenosylmethionine ribosyltransferase-isomerase QueA [Deltaproteobacteria bacterium]|nr:tRNA preQ1(34) S-adenosylmethionine ribosyltransferase-isomerase QueA [Deltaproteobacteria bacterium]
MFSPFDYHYELPKELIAQQPAHTREHSRLLCMDRNTGEMSHYRFHEISNLLMPGDVLVLNNTEVIPGRLLGKKSTGGKAEVLILDFAGGRSSQQKTGEFICECLIKASKSPKPGTYIQFEKGLEAEVIDTQGEISRVRFLCQNDFEETLYELGKVPLPPYIKRDNNSHDTIDDTASYQTVYALEKGAIAAPTAGLHFSEKLLGIIKDKGIEIVYITLHVGYGTFLPVRASDIRDHQMHSERFFISSASAKRINTAKAEGRRIVAVGTTCVRTLEYAADSTGNLAEGQGQCDLFIYPPYRFKVIDAMITNFHLPASTLLMLVSAFAGRDKILHAYQEAIEKKYRFFSYGDAMFIE